MGRVHVEAWREIHAGPLPPEALERLLARSDRAGWVAGAVSHRRGGGCGHCRRRPLRRDGWEGELYAIYLLRRAQGRRLGRALFRAVQPGVAFTCCVVVGNDPACRFYGAMGGRILLTRDEAIAGTPIREHVFAWGEADAAPRPQV